MSTSVGIVVLSWNRCARVLACIARVKRLEVDDVDVTIIVVDNASADGSVTAVRHGHPEVVILPQVVNIGFVGGVNAGLAEVVARQLDYAWLLNDDTEFEDAILRTMIDHAKTHPRFSIFSPVIRDDDEKRGIQFCNGLVEWRTSRLHDRLPIDRFADLVAAGGTPVLIGTAMLIATPVIEAITGFDAQFFAYWEDIDFTVRAARRGFVSDVVLGATVLHDSPGRNERPPHYYYYMIRNEALFWRKHASRRVRWQRRWLGNALVRVGENRDLGNDRNVQACVDGLWDGVCGRSGPRIVERAAPGWFLRLLTSHPHFLALALQGRFKVIAGRAVRR